jgi:hypothetical protein
VKQGTGPILDEFYTCFIRTVPGKAGYLTLSQGVLTNGKGFFYSTNYGVTWSTMANVTDVWCHGYGAVQGASAYPTLWISGKVGGVIGIWKSTNFGATWTQYSGNSTAFPFSLIVDQPVCINGDMNDSTKVYIGYNASGFWVGTNLT